MCTLNADDVMLSILKNLLDDIWKTTSELVAHGIKLTFMNNFFAHF